LAKGKLYTEVEIWTFHASMVDDVIDRLFGFCDQFDDLCFLLPKNFYNSSKFSSPINSGFSFPNIEEGNLPKLWPRNLAVKPSVDFTSLYSCIENDINFNRFDSNWDKHLSKVIKRKKEEEETTLSEVENEREEIPDEPNHDPCEDFEFDKTGSRTKRSSNRNHAKKFGEGWICV
jgi:hypothetical protein